MRLQAGQLLKDATNSTAPRPIQEESTARTNASTTEAECQRHQLDRE
jgi:hypothetical protein